MSTFDPVLLYTKEISSLSNGLAIWHPHPGAFWDDQKKLKFRPHVRPGDVGYMETDGTFIRLFNIHLESNHSDQGLGPLPELFECMPIKPKKDLDLSTQSRIVYTSQRRSNRLFRSKVKL